MITEPFTIMLWGITTESVGRWLNGAPTQSSSDRHGGVAGHRRRARARAAVGRRSRPDRSTGEILVAPVTAPSWAPVFGKIKATVTDIGGMMSHAAIVCREYGLPAVTGTGNATTSIKTGQMLRVNGSTGEVTILS